MSVDSRLFGSLRARMIGPYRGGRTVAVDDQLGWVHQLPFMVVTSHSAICGNRMTSAMPNT